MAKNKFHKAYRNENLNKKHLIHVEHRKARRELHEQRRGGIISKADMREKLRGLIRSEKRALHVLHQELRAFRQKYKMFANPLMAYVFDIAEEGRADPNSRTPFDEEIRIEKDIVYKTVDGEDLKLDLYFPSRPIEGRAPVVMDIPGGGWMIHNRPRRDGYARCFAAMGAVVAVIDHRLCPGSFFPADLHDCVDAYNWLVDHADTYNLDPNNITVTGDSSGGHLSACMGCVATSEEYRAKLELPALQSKPAALIFISGAFSFDIMYRIPFTHTLIVRYYSGAKTRRAFRKWKYYKESIPYNYINPDFPPSYNNGGKSDFLCLGEAKRMADILSQNNVPNNYRLGRDIFNSGHCYVLCFNLESARKDAVHLYQWYYMREAELGVDLTAGFRRVERYFDHYHDVMSGKMEC